MNDLAGPVDDRGERQRCVDDRGENLTLRGFAGGGGRPFDQAGCPDPRPP